MPGEEAISVEGDTLAIDPLLFQVDVVRFETLSEEGTRAALEEAADLYGGDFLEGVVDPTEPFAEWVAYERMHLRERIVVVLEKLLPSDLSNGRIDHAIQRALCLLAIDPLDERVHRLLMRLYLEQGRLSAALKQYRLCCTVLHRELDAQPDRETEELYRQILERNRTKPPDSPHQHNGDARPSIEKMLSRPAVAVPPFTNLNDDPGQAYFSDGVSEDIVTMLAGWRRFPLIASSSSLTYRDRSVDIRQIADELGAGYVVTGSVRQAGKRARINARLIEAQSGYVHWTKRYDVDFSDILEAQEDIAEKIAAAIEPALESAELARITTLRTSDVSAWDYFLRGTSFLHRYTRESNAQALKNFQQAIALDQGYSDAYTGLALSYLRNLLIKSPGSTVKEDKHDRAKQITLASEAARKAVALDPNSSDAHLQVGTAYVWVEDFDSAIFETELAVELNPRDLNRWNYMGYLSRAYLDSHQCDEALSWAKKALLLRPDQPEAHFRLAVCLAHLGHQLEAQTALAECERLCPGFTAMKASWKPYSDPDRSEHYFAGLRRLSLSD